MKERRGKLVFKLGVSRRYCAKCAIHYARLTGFSTILGLLGGSAVVVDILSDLPIASNFGAGVILVSTLFNLIFKWPEKARFFSLQDREYTLLQERFERLGDMMTEEGFRNLKADMIRLEADEGETKHALMVICHNEECSARGHPDYKRKLHFYQRWLAPFVSLPPVVWE